MILSLSMTRARRGETFLIRSQAAWNSPTAEERIRPEEISEERADRTLPRETQNQHSEG